MSHVDAAHRYARDIVAGKIPACEWTRLACQRQLDDLKRWQGKKGPYWFDKQAAEDVCEFISLLPHIKGEWANRRELITLEPWQAFILCTVFGWKRADGTRRFRTAYIEVPRKNAKSTLSSGVALYMLAMDGESGAEVYSAATTRDQAQIVFRDAREMARKSPDFCAAAGVQINAHNLNVAATASKFQPLSAEGNSLDGLNIHCAIIDELHAHKSRTVFDAIASGMGARLQPLLWLITTAGFNRSGVCYEQRDYVKKLLSGVLDHEGYFGIVYSIDDDDDWKSDLAHRKANPNYGVSVYPLDMRDACRRADGMSQELNGFLTKRLNIWTGSGTSWLKAGAWDACESADITLDDFIGKPCWIGLDLASKKDVAALVMLFPDGDGYALSGKYYLPEDTVEANSGRHAHYAGWARDGYFTVTPGQITDFGIIKEDIIDISKMFDVRGIAYDPWQATHLASELMAEGAPMIEYRNTVANMSEPMKTLEALILSEQLRHDGNPAMGWMMSNVVAELDRKDNIMPRKETPDSKIDGPVATIMALGLAISNDQQADESYTATHGVVMLA